ncbi:MULTISPECIES: FadR/GntR family transcriptional regulator [unclassified Achromobacter]|uniref:FadR/GntR family transcriptional regulator n=1 Tax=unclassified Achromobacter TaxID=2626865 RepID=UPI00069E6591|nr:MULTISPECIES: FadR/GntR family transcriptional regulator [unclassified Achromobacter]KOF54407.1 GntR family transcriptional regulator [Achromobacter sp. DMS1]
MQPSQDQEPTRPAPRSSLSAGLAETLADQIRQGVLAPGDRLPTEKQLTEAHNVSRAVVREALARLKSEGLVTSQQGSGVFVDPNFQKNAFRIAAPAPGDTQELEHILELMLSIEVTAARYAAQRRTEADLKKIRQALVGMEYALLHDRLGDEEDYQFHQAIVQATHNPHLVALNDYLEANVRRVIRSARHNTARMFAERMAAVQNEHQAIFSAIESGDPDAAGRAAETHLRNAADRLRLFQAERPPPV